MSHFSTIKTQLRKKEPLLQALVDLGYIPEKGERLIRGYRGKTVEAELAVSTKEGSEIGFRLNPVTNTYELVTDLDLWSQPVPIERFLSQLTQRYALNTVITASASEGFEISRQTNNTDGSIELVVTRWDP